MTTPVDGFWVLTWRFVVRSSFRRLSFLFVISVLLFETPDAAKADLAVLQQAETAYSVLHTLQIQIFLSPELDVDGVYMNLERLWLLLLIRRNISTSSDIRDMTRAHFTWCALYIIPARYREMQYSFHSTVGRHLSVEKREAFRPNGSTHDHGLCYCNQPLAAWKPFSFRVSRVTSRWRGGLTFGVMACSPEDLNLTTQPPAACPAGLDEKLQKLGKPYFFMCGITKKERYLVHQGQRQKATLSCPVVGMGDIISIVMTDGRKVYFTVNGGGVELLGEFAEEADPVYVVLDVCGGTVGISNLMLPSLTDCCRTVIRKFLQPSSPEAVLSLPLPPPLLRHLSFQPFLHMPEAQLVALWRVVRGDTTALIPSLLQDSSTKDIYPTPVCCCSRAWLRCIFSIFSRGCFCFLAYVADFTSLFFICHNYTWTIFNFTYAWS